MGSIGTSISSFHTVLCIEGIELFVRVFCSPLLIDLYVSGYFVMICYKTVDFEYDCQ